LYVYGVSLDAAGRQSRHAVDLDGKGNPTVNLGVSVSDVTIFARVNPDFVRYAPGIYNNLRVTLAPVTNIIK